MKHEVKGKEKTFFLSFRRGTDKFRLKDESKAGIMNYFLIWRRESLRHKQEIY